MNTWERYVAIGDSFTEGMADADPTRDDTFVGWADRLAARLGDENASAGSPFGYANLAIRGKKLDDVVGRQLDAALDLRPDLVSIVAGGNDTLRPHVDLERLADRLEAAVSRIRQTGADVLMATPADTGWAPLFNKLRPRNAVLAANVWGIAARHGCYVLDLFTMRSLWDARMWAADRIHFSTEGHRRIAEQAHWTLQSAGLRVQAGDRPWAVPLGPAPRPSRRETIAADAAWLREFAGPWINRRLHGTSSGDGRAPKRAGLEPIDRFLQEQG